MFRIRFPHQRWVFDSLSCASKTNVNIDSMLFVSQIIHSPLCVHCILMSHSVRLLLLLLLLLMMVLPLIIRVFFFIYFCFSRAESGDHRVGLPNSKPLHNGLFQGVQRQSNYFIIGSRCVRMRNWTTNTEQREAQDNEAAKAIFHVSPLLPFVRRSDWKQMQPFMVSRSQNATINRATPAQSSPAVAAADRN